MQLQKLVFLAQGLSLAFLDEPLTYHNIHAWQWGPVLPQLYKRFSAYGSGGIEHPAPTDEVIPEQDQAQEIIQAVWKNYGKFTGPQLSSLTHKPGSPWDITWKSTQYGIIPTSLIQDFYRKQLNVAQQGQS